MKNTKSKTNKTKTDKTVNKPIDFKPRFTFNIDRSKWSEGSLLEGTGKMCAMGFLGKAIGIPKKEMKFRGYHDMVGSPHRDKWLALGFLKCNGDSITQTNKQWEVARINDTRHADREKKLETLFKQMNIKVTFSGKSEK